MTKPIEDWTDSQFNAVSWWAGNLISGLEINAKKMPIGEFHATIASILTPQQVEQIASMYQKQEPLYVESFGNPNDNGAVLFRSNKSIPLEAADELVRQHGVSDLITHHEVDASGNVIGFRFNRTIDLDNVILLSPEESDKLLNYTRAVEEVIKKAEAVKANGATGVSRQ